MCIARATSRCTTTAPRAPSSIDRDRSARCAAASGTSTSSDTEGPPPLRPTTRTIRRRRRARLTREQGRMGVQDRCDQPSEARDLSTRAWQRLCRRTRRGRLRLAPSPSVTSQRSHRAVKQCQFMRLHVKTHTCVAKVVPFSIGLEIAARSRSRSPSCGRIQARPKLQRMRLRMQTRFMIMTIDIVIDLAREHQTID